MMKKVPKRRFKGFLNAGDWEQCKLGDLLILLKDGSHGTHKNTSEGVYLLSAKNIKNGRINIMPDDRIISWDDYNVIHKNYELQIGDILLTIVGSIGETAIYNLKMKVTFQRSVAFLRPNSKLKNGFLYTLINTDRFQNQLQTKQVVSAQPGIYLGDLASINITYPKNVSEQEKIYNIFKGIEDSITLHQRKLEKLQATKKALLYELFPIENSRRPKRRFKGFTDDWEQRKLGEITERYDNLRVPITANLRIPGNTPYYGANGIQDYVEGHTHEGEFVLVAEDGANDLKNYPVQFVNGRIWVNNHAHVLQGKKDIIDNHFLAYAIRRTNMGSLLVGGSRPKLNAETLMKIAISVPEIEEQRMVGTQLNQFDNLITLHQRKLEKLKNLKAAYLNEMFV